MRLERKGSKASINSHISFKDLKSYIGALVDMYAAAYINKSSWLRKTERSFFIATVIHVNSGYNNPISDESVQIYKQYFNPNVTKVKIADYINRVRSRKWIRYDKITKEVTIPPAFMNININSDIFDFNCRFSYERSKAD